VKREIIQRKERNLRVQLITSEEKSLTDVYAERTPNTCPKTQNKYIQEDMKTKSVFLGHLFSRIYYLYM
jgi:hypothetical protein